MEGFGPVGKSGGMERAEEKTSGFVSREHASCSIAAMGCRSQADDQNLRAGIAQGRKRSGPIGLLHESFGRIARGELAPGHEARAAPAGDDLPLHSQKRLPDFGFRISNLEFGDWNTAIQFEIRNSKFAIS